MPGRQRAAPLGPAGPTNLWLKSPLDVKGPAETCPNDGPVDNLTPLAASLLPTGSSRIQALISAIGAGLGDVVRDPEVTRSPTVATIRAV